MSHLFKLILLKISTSINKDSIIIAKENKLNDPSETKLVILGIVGVCISYLVYWGTKNFLIDLKYNALIIFFILATITVLVDNIVNIKDVLIYKAEDDYLFSLPLTSSDIIISKLFMPYIKNLIYVFIILFPPYLVFKDILHISETSSLIYLLAGITLPLIPLIIGTVYAFVDSYYNHSNKKRTYKIFKYLFILLIIGVLFLLFYNKKNTINNIITKISILNPFIYFFKNALIKNSFFSTILLIFLPVLLFGIFIKKISINYNYIISRIRGVKLNSGTTPHPSKPKKTVHSLIHKEIITIFNNKIYFRNSIFLSMMLSILFIIVSIIFNTNKINKIHDFGIFLMLFLSFASAISCTTINSLSLEKNNIIYFKCLPIKFYKLLLSKFLVNIITSLPFIIINLLVTIIFYKVSPITLLTLFINPLLLTTFISLLGLILDYRFINYKEKNSNNIIKNRLITYIPILTNILVISSIFLINPIDNYNVILFLFSAINILLIIIALLYLLLNYKKIYNTNIK